MAQQLTLSARPKTLSALIGQDKVVKRIRGQMETGRLVKAWLFVGPTGTGKTTAARILSLSLQCNHQKEFGAPCDECRKNKSSFDIVEHPCAKFTGKDDFERALEGAEFAPRSGNCRVYILDEIQRASKQAQDLVLKYLEDTPDTTVFILCTTHPHMLAEALQGRCSSGLCEMKALELDDITKLVTRLLKKVASKLPVDRLVDELAERSIAYPRYIAGAVERYVAGSTPQEAVEVQASELVDTKALTRSVIKGDWPSVAQYLVKAQASDVRAIRLGCLAYMRKMLLNSPEISESTKAVAEGIKELAVLHNAEEIAVVAGLSATLYTVTSYFARYRH